MKFCKKMSVNRIWSDDNQKYNEKTILEDKGKRSKLCVCEKGNAISYLVPSNSDCKAKVYAHIEYRSASLSFQLRTRSIKYSLSHIREINIDCAGNAEWNMKTMR